MAMLEVSDIDMGTIPLSKTKQAVFTIQNTGDNPLIIVDVAVSCGCVAVTFDKHLAQIGETLNVVVDMTPKGSGFFCETITVKCNTTQNIRLTIRGQVQ